MDAPEIMARSMSVPRETGQSKWLWQYHSQSDRHSQVSCWGVLFDLMHESALLRSHIEAGKAYFGVNHKMVDFVNKKKKRLDLVVCRPDGMTTGRTFAELADDQEILLTKAQKDRLANLPPILEAPVGAVLVALEAKACMTAHGKSVSRLYDELNSSQGIVHGASNNALSIGLITVNVAEEFVSPGRNKQFLQADRTAVSKHRQPDAALKIYDLVDDLPRRTSKSSVGFDGLGVIALNLRNDGVTPVLVHTGHPAPKPGEMYHYETMVRRMANEYDSAFAKI